MSLSRRNRYYVTFMSACAHSSVFKNLLLLPPTGCRPHLHVHMLVISLRGLTLHFSSSFVSFSSKWKHSSCHGTYGNVSVCLKSALCANSIATLACTCMKIVIISPANQLPPHTKIQFMTTHFVDIYCISIMLFPSFYSHCCCAFCCEIWDKIHILLHFATKNLYKISRNIPQWLAFNFIAASVMLRKSQMTFWWWKLFL